MLNFLADLFAAKPTRVPNPKARLGLEQLDDRRLPSVSVWTTADGHTPVGDPGLILHVVGDDRRDVVALVVNDDTNTLRCTATGLRQTLAFASDTIANVVVELNGGDDVVTYTYAGSAIRYSKDIDIKTGEGFDSCSIVPESGSVTTCRTLTEITVDTGDQADDVLVVVPRVVSGLEVNIYLGYGDDTATVRMDGDIATSGDATIRVNGGSDEDTIAFEAVATDRNANGFEVENGGHLLLILAGDGQRDEIDVTCHGRLRGLVQLDARGGDGDDTLDVDLNITDGSYGNVYAWVYGDGGNDRLSLGVKKGTGATGRNTFEIRGGEGTDTCRLAGPGVTVKECEWFTIFLPVVSAPV